jgi:hypothetical protein
MAEDRQTERQRNKQIDEHAGSHTDRQIERKIKKQEDLIKCFADRQTNRKSDRQSRTPNHGMRRPLFYHCATCSELILSVFMQQQLKSLN